MGRSQVETESLQHKEKSLISGCLVICSSVRLSFLTFGRQSRRCTTSWTDQGHWTCTAQSSSSCVQVHSFSCIRLHRYLFIGRFLFESLYFLHFSVTFTVYKYALSLSECDKNFISFFGGRASLFRKIRGRYGTVIFISAADFEFVKRVVQTAGKLY